MSLSSINDKRITINEKIRSTFHFPLNEFLVTIASAEVANPFGDWHFAV